jgi:predicted TIM-barrel fold metal-dependent hydrolase
MRRVLGVLSAALVTLLAAPPAGAQEQPTTTTARPSPPAYEFNDSHFHLTNYIQEGIGIEEFLEIMGDKAGRVALFGIPLQQTWSYANSGDFAPRYYTESDAPLYYYSFTDAYIANAYLSLPPAQRARFDPMITGFNPADMYAADHIERVLRVYPGVFTGIGEFSIHKEFVSSKVAGEVASLKNPALDRIFRLCGEIGLIALLHNDIDMPFSRPGVAEPVYLNDMKDVLRRHPKAVIIWAHTGLGRVVHPFRAAAGSIAERNPEHLRILEGMLADRSLSHVYFDISWDEVAKYVVATPESLKATAELINRYPDRFLFGTDEVAPPDRESYLKIYKMYEPLWEGLTPEAREKVKKGNYERLFDAARKKVRAWEQANVPRRPD